LASSGNKLCARNAEHCWNLFGDLIPNVGQGRTKRLIFDTLKIGATAHRSVDLITASLLVGPVADAACACNIRNSTNGAVAQPLKLVHTSRKTGSNSASLLGWAQVDIPQRLKSSVLFVGSNNSADWYESHCCPLN
jgi:hypothetical protein